MTVWYIARGAGLAALILLTLSTCVGALMSRRTSPGNRVLINYLHRVTASTGLAVLALHIGTILADSYAHVGWTASLTPFTSSFRPLWIGLATLSVYTFVLVAAVGMARGRMATSRRGAAVWRWLHGLAYLGWALAILHGLKSGTDTSVGWVQAIYVLCAGAVAGAIAARILLARRHDLVRPSVLDGPPIAPADRDALSDRDPVLSSAGARGGRR